MEDVIKKFSSKIKKYVLLLINKFVYLERSFYLKIKRRRNRNVTPTIISNNCVGGIMYHDLEIEFLSPTINLFFEGDSFIVFLNDLRYYLSCIPEEIHIDGIKYPVGVLRKNDKEVVIHFMHYSSFEDAKTKWVERSKRVDFENLYIVLEKNTKTNSDDEIYKKFKALPFKNKRFITWTDDIKDVELIDCPFYSDNYYPGKILEYPKLFSIKRYLDYFDYVSFLNNK